MQDSLAGFTLLASIVIFGMSVVALFKPLPKLWMPDRKGALRGFGVAAVLFVATAIIIPQPKTEKGQASAQAVQPTVAPAEPAATVGPVEEQQPTLEFTPPLFAERFNALAKAADKPWRISAFAQEKTSIKYMLSDHLGFVGNVGSNGNVQGLMVLGSGDGTLGSGVDVFMVMSIAYCAANDLIDLKRCGPPVLKLTQDFKEGEEASKMVANNIKWTFTRNDLMGSILILDPA